MTDKKVIKLYNDIARCDGREREECTTCARRIADRPLYVVMMPASKDDVCVARIEGFV